MKTNPSKSTTISKTARRPEAEKSNNDRATLVALYLFAASMLLGILYFLSLVLFI